MIPNPTTTLMYVFYGCLCFLAGFTSSLLSFPAMPIIFSFLSLPYFEVNLFKQLFLSVYSDFIFNLLSTLVYGYQKQVIWSASIYSVMFSIPASFLVSFFLGNYIVYIEKYVKGGGLLAMFVISITFFIQFLLGIRFKHMDISEEEKNGYLKNKLKKFFTNLVLPKKKGKQIIDDESINVQNSEREKIEDSSSKENNKKDKTNKFMDVLGFKNWYNYPKESRKKNIIRTFFFSLTLLLFSCISGFIKFTPGLFINRFLRRWYNQSVKTALATACFMTCICSFSILLSFFNHVEIFDSELLIFCGITFGLGVLGTFLGNCFVFFVSDLFILLIISIVERNIRKSNKKKINDVIIKRRRSDVISSSNNPPRGISIRQRPQTSQGYNNRRHWVDLRRNGGRKGRKHVVRTSWYADIDVGKLEKRFKRERKQYYRRSSQKNNNGGRPKTANGAVYQSMLIRRSRKKNKDRGSIDGFSLDIQKIQVSKTRTKIVSL